MAKKGVFFIQKTKQKNQKREKDETFLFIEAAFEAVVLIHLDCVIWMGSFPIFFLFKLIIRL